MNEENSVDLDGGHIETRSTGPVKLKRDRSTIKFPYRDIVESENLVQQLYSELGGSGTSDQLAAAAGFSSSANGAFTQRLAALGHFGLMVRDGDSLRITDRGLALLEPTTNKQAKIEAFLAVPLYQAVYEKFKGQRLPGISGLEMALKELGVTDATAQSARQVLMRSARQAGFFDLADDRLVMPVLKPSSRTPNGDSANSDESLDPLEELRRENAALKERKSSIQVGETPPGVVHPLLLSALSTLPKPDTHGRYMMKHEKLEAWVSNFTGALKLVYEDEEPPG